MSFAAATSPDGEPLGLVPPLDGDALRQLEHVAFQLPCEDPWLEDAGSPGHTYLEAAEEAWEDHPEWMDFLALDSPARDLKRAARDVYLHWLEPRLDGVQTVLDVGCGIGRFTQPLLDRGLSVTGVDGDLQSLQRCAWHAAGREGQLELHWSTPFKLPPVTVDLALAVEVLCYFEDPLAALRQVVQRVRPGGQVFLAMEARYGWACSPDAPAYGIEALLNDADTLHLPGDRFVRLFDEDGVRQLLEQAGLEVVQIVATHYLPDGPLEDLLPDDLTKEILLDLEDRCRNHPVWKPLNRIWVAVARVPAAP